jgi:hypothetical protein
MLIGRIVGSRDIVWDGRVFRDTSTLILRKETFGFAKFNKERGDV